MTANEIAGWGVLAGLVLVALWQPILGRLWSTSREHAGARHPVQPEPEREPLVWQLQSTCWLCGHTSTVTASDITIRPDGEAWRAIASCVHCIGDTFEQQISAAVRSSFLACGAREWQPTPRVPDVQQMDSDQIWAALERPPS